MLTIAILNSMPEMVARSTERPFKVLLTEAAGMDAPLHIRWFSLQPRDGYERVQDLWATNNIDGPIATGTEPLAEQLSDEPYWGAFARTIDWAIAQTTSAIWSCLAAPVAVRYLSREAGADPFVKTCGGACSCLSQGENIGLGGPDSPCVLRALRERAIATRDQRIMIDMQGIVGKAVLLPMWKPVAVRLYRNRLNILVPQRANHLAYVAS